MTNTTNDDELLREYRARSSEHAFSELVRRHLDVVYSAARRIVRDPSLAEDVTQQVFLALAANASQLAGHPALCGWLHQTTRNVAGKIVRSEVRRRAREGEVARMQNSFETESTWAQVEPQLDAALGDLTDHDREIVLLRFFHGKSARQIAENLAISEEAAQKRVHRALERLRRILAGRGVSAPVQALAASIAAHSTAAAPASIALAISSALVRNTIQHGALFAARDAWTMTLMQKSIIAVSVVAAVGVGFWEYRQSLARQDQIKIIEQRLVTVSTNLNDARARRDQASARLIAAQAEQQRLREFANSVPQLRQEISRIKATGQPSADEPADPATENWLERVQALKKLPAAMPDKAIPELALLQDDDWIEVAKKSLEWEEPDTNGQIKWYLLSSQPLSLMTRRDPALSEAEQARLRFQELRTRAKLRFGSTLARALQAYAAAHEGRIPTDLPELRPYFATAPDDSMLARYEVRQKGLLQEQPSGQVVIAEKSFADPLFDTRLVLEGTDGIRLQEMIEVEASVQREARP